MSKMQAATTAMAWDVNLATRMRNTGMTYKQIGAVFGLTDGTVHSRIDPEYRSKRNAQKNAGRRYISAMTPYRQYGERKTDEEAAMRLAETPEDTRDFTARTFGDPVFARSAASRKPETVQRNGKGCRAWGSLPKAHKEPYLVDAGTAITMVAVPTPPMIENGVLAYNLTGIANGIVNTAEDHVAYIFSAMLLGVSSDAALSNTRESRE